MKAMAIETHGGPETFRPVEAPDPAPGDGEVTIAVRASSVNPVDYKIRDGRAARLCPRLPAILHADCAGVVSAVGAGVEGLREGDEVYAFATGIGGKPGALAEFMAADARMVAPKPASLSFEEAAALPLVTVTAWFCYFDRDDLQPERLGAGARGHGRRWPCRGAARGVARRRGLRDVRQRREMPHRRGPRRAARVQLCGDGPGGDIRRSARGRGVRLCVQHPRRAGESTHRWRRRATSARFWTFWGTSRRSRAFRRSGLAFKSVFAGRPMVSGDRVGAVGEILREARDMVAEGALRPLVDKRRFGFSEVGAAHSHAEHGRPTGKVVLYNDL